MSRCPPSFTGEPSAVSAPVDLIFEPLVEPSAAPTQDEKDNTVSEEEGGLLGLLLVITQHLLQLHRRHVGDHRSDLQKQKTKKLFSEVEQTSLHVLFFRVAAPSSGHQGQSQSLMD